MVTDQRASLDPHPRDSHKSWRETKCLCRAALPRDQHSKGMSTHQMANFFFFSFFFFFFFLATIRALSLAQCAERKKKKKPDGKLANGAMRG